MSIIDKIFFEKPRQYLYDFAQKEIFLMPEMKGAQVVTDPMLWDVGKVYIPRGSLVVFARCKAEARQKVESFLEGTWRAEDDVLNYKPGTASI